MGATDNAASGGVFIVSVSSDIGEQLALDYLTRGLRGAGTYRSRLPDSLQDRADFSGLHCDVAQPESAAAIRGVRAICAEGGEGDRPEGRGAICGALPVAAAALPGEMVWHHVE